MKSVLFLLGALLSLAGNAQRNGAEWAQMKRDCGLSPSLAYNDWVKQGMPCNNGSNNNSQPTGPTADEIAAERAAAAQNKRATEAHDLNEQGIDAYNRGDYQTAIQYFEDALDKTPGASTIQENIQKAKDQLAFQAAEKKRRDQDAFNQNKQQGLNQLRGISESGNFDKGLKDGSSAGAGSMELKTLPNANTDTHVVDGSKVPSGLPKLVDDAIVTGYSAAPAGVSDRVRKGFQAIAAHDWKVARAWFADALNHDPGNAGLKRLVELSDYTGQSIEQRKAGKPTDASWQRKQLQLPQDSDMRFLFPGLSTGSPASGKAMELPRASDIEFLFPGIAANDAGKMNDYMFDQMIKATANDPQLIKVSNPDNSNQPRNPYELK